MSEPNFLSFTVKRNLAVSATVFLVSATLSFGIGLFSNGAHAMTSSSNNQVQPYTGGTPVAKVFYLADGSTVTITCTGAVIKQSPGGNPYREGWINPSQTGSLSTAADLKGQLSSGSTNPNGSANACPSSSAGQTQPSNNQQTTPPSSNTTPAPQTQTPAPSVSSTSTANANASANVILAGSGGSASTATSQSPGVQNTTATASTPTVSAPVQALTSAAGKGLPNTGPGNVLAFSGITTVLATIGHFAYQRLRYRSLA